MASAQRTFRAQERNNNRKSIKDIQICHLRKIPVDNPKKDTFLVEPNNSDETFKKPLAKQSRLEKLRYYKDEKSFNKIGGSRKSMLPISRIASPKFFNDGILAKSNGGKTSLPLLSKIRFPPPRLSTCSKKDASSNIPKSKNSPSNNTQKHTGTAPLNCINQTRTMEPNRANELSEKESSFCSIIELPLESPLFPNDLSCIHPISKFSFAPDDFSFSVPDSVKQLPTFLLKQEHDKASNLSRVSTPLPIKIQSKVLNKNMEPCLDITKDLENKSKYVSSLPVSTSKSLSAKILHKENMAPNKSPALSTTTTLAKEKLTNSKIAVGKPNGSMLYTKQKDRKSPLLGGLKDISTSGVNAMSGERKKTSGLSNKVNSTPLLRPACKSPVARIAATAKNVQGVKGGLLRQSLSSNVKQGNQINRTIKTDGNNSKQLINAKQTSQSKNNKLDLKNKVAITKPVIRSGTKPQKLPGKNVQSTGDMKNQTSKSSEKLKASYSFDVTPEVTSRVSNHAQCCDRASNNRNGRSQTLLKTNSSNASKDRCITNVSENENSSDSSKSSAKQKPAEDQVNVPSVIDYNTDGTGGKKKIVVKMDDFVSSDDSFVLNVISQDEDSLDSTTMSMKQKPSEDFSLVNAPSIKDSNTDGTGGEKKIAVKMHDFVSGGDSFIFDARQDTNSSDSTKLLIKPKLSKVDSFKWDSSSLLSIGDINGTIEKKEISREEDGFVSCHSFVLNSVGRDSNSSDSTRLLTGQRLSDVLVSDVDFSGPIEGENCEKKDFQYTKRKVMSLKDDKIHTTLSFLTTCFIEDEVLDDDISAELAALDLSTSINLNHSCFYTPKKGSAKKDLNPKGINFGNDFAGLQFPGKKKLIQAPRFSSPFLKRINSFSSLPDSRFRANFMSSCEKDKIISNDQVNETGCSSQNFNSEVSLLGTPLKPKPSMNVSVRGDLISFSPVVNKV